MKTISSMLLERTIKNVERIEQKSPYSNDQIVLRLDDGTHVRIMADYNGLSGKLVITQED